MNALHDFKRSVLTSLLRGERPPGDTSLTLFAAEFNQPLDYLFETNRWDEVFGAGRRLSRAAEKVRTLLSADGYTANELLHVTATGLFTLAGDQAANWGERIERAVAQETDVVTVSTVTYPITVQQVLGGLYRAPRAVIGVPGVNDYQERINRYYGVANPATVPNDDAVLSRRHFGEVVALSHSLLTRSRESRQILPFYEALPFAERCASCKIRPAEKLDDGPVCGVCRRKRSEPNPPRFQQVGLLWLESVELNRLLEQQHTPAEYHRLFVEVDETLHSAIPNRLGGVVLASGVGWMLIAFPAAEAVEAAVTALEAISVHYGWRSPTGFLAALGLGNVPPQTLRESVNRVRATLHRGFTGTQCLLDFWTVQPGIPFDRFRKPYTIDQAKLFLAGVSALREAKLPPHFLPDLSGQMARGGVGLYYTFERSKLPTSGQEALSQLERVWEAGTTPGPRFYAMLADALALVRLEP